MTAMIVVGYIFGALVTCLVIYISAGYLSWDKFLAGMLSLMSLLGFWPIILIGVLIYPLANKISEIFWDLGRKIKIRSIAANAEKERQAKELEEFLKVGRPVEMSATYRALHLGNEDLVVRSDKRK